LLEKFVDRRTDLSECPHNQSALEMIPMRGRLQMQA